MLISAFRRSGNFPVPVDLNDMAITSITIKKHREINGLMAPYVRFPGPIRSSVDLLQHSQGTDMAIDAKHSVSGIH